MLEGPWAGGGGAGGRGSFGAGGGGGRNGVRVSGAFSVACTGYNLLT